MPAESQVQQQAMAIELERRRKGKAPRRFKDMSMAQLADFARTKRKNLPKHKGKSRDKKAPRRRS